MIRSVWYNGKGLGVAQIWVPNNALLLDSCVTCVTQLHGVVGRFKCKGPTVVHMTTNVSSLSLPISSPHPPLCHTVFIITMLSDWREV